MAQEETKINRYALLPANRAGGKKSDGRRVWLFMERGRRPRKRSDTQRASHSKPQACKLTQNESCAVAQLEAAWPLSKVLWDEYDT